MTTTAAQAAHTITWGDFIDGTVTTWTASCSCGWTVERKSCSARTVAVKKHLAASGAERRWL